jgi:hypothetical protein
MNNTHLTAGVALALAKDIERRIAELRRIALEPVSIRISAHVDIEVRPKSDDDRVLVGRDGWGCTVVNYTSEGLILDVLPAESIDIIHTASIGRDELEHSEAFAGFCMAKGALHTGREATS